MTIIICSPLTSITCMIKLNDATVYLQCFFTVPCRPTNTKALLHCHSNSAAVTWEKASGALAYVAIGVTADGSHWTECNNTETYCDLRDLQCGQTYNVSVFGQDESCSSTDSDTAYMQTGTVNISGAKPNSPLSLVWF